MQPILSLLKSKKPIKTGPAKLFLIISILFAATFIMVIHPAQAQETDPETVQVVVNYEKINPDSFFYPLKRVWEKINLAIIFNEKDRQDYMQKLVENRFNELVYIANNKKLTEFNQTASRYNSLVGEYLDKYHDARKEMNESARNYERILGDLKSQYETDYAYWSFLKSSQETTQRLSGS